MHDHTKMGRYEMLDLFVLMCPLNEEDTLMPCVQSRFLDKGTNATRWIWLQ